MDKKEKKVPAFGWVFAGLILLTVLVGAGLFLLWAWVSYRMRFSAELIRVGIRFLYFLPCLFGGKMLVRTRCRNTLLWGAGLGACFYGVLLVVSLIGAAVTDTGLSEPDWTDALPLFLCLLGGVAGTIGKKSVLIP